MADIAAAHAKLIQDRSIQVTFSEAAPPQPPSSPGWSLAGTGGPLFWVVAIVAVLALAAILAQRLRGGAPARPKPTKTNPTPDIALPAAALAPALIDADTLAAQGDYAAAAHALLLRGIAAIDTQFPRLLRPAHTSRDIAALDPLPAPARHAFAAIAAHVERALFARRPLGRPEWEACRSLYGRLLK